MRIAYLTQPYPPMISGAALVVQQLAEAMANRGHQVLVIAASDQEYPYHTYKDNLTIIRLTSVHNPMRVNQRFLLFPHIAIIKALTKFRPDIIHAHEPFQTAWAGITYSRHHQIPITLTVHQLPWFAASYLPDMLGIRPFVKSILWYYAHWILTQFTSVTCPSKTVSQLVANITGIQLKTISNGISLETFHPPLPADDGIEMRKRLNLPQGVPLILHLGRLDIDKNVDRVILAASQAVQQTNAHILIVGDGSQKPDLMKMCKTLGISDRTHFPGYISLQEGLPQIYRLACLFVTASEIEIQSLVLLESIASGLPIVAVRASFIPEIVHNAVNGYLVEPDDTPAMTEAIKTILANPRKARQMGQASRILAEGHGHSCTVKAFEELYYQLITQFQNQDGKNKSALSLQWNRVKSWIGLRR